MLILEHNVQAAFQMPAKANFRPINLAFDVCWFKLADRFSNLCT